jgi:GAF domain-containing protein
MHSNQQPVLAALVEPTPALTSVNGLTGMLDSMVRALAQLVPGTQMGICARNSAGTHETLAGTHRLAFALDNIQRHLDEGPGLTVLQEDHTVIIDDAESEHRWPNFMPYAVDLGLRSYLGVSISVEETTLGALSLYSTNHTRLDAGRLSHAKVFAAQAAIALRQAQREIDLVEALRTSRAIGKATGLVMERFDLDDEDAFEYLARLSQKTNLKLRDIAAHLVKQSNELCHLQRAKPTA